MTVRHDAPGATIRLEGACPVGEAETLLALLDAHPAATIDLGAATSLHAAVVQVLLVRRPARTGALPADAFLATWIAALLDRPPAL